ncbi:cupin domain-containing protein [Gimesia sp.]|uniref:cupin domain-containing protein n=1 Tax=Gimesia sp. TaxID=2024833 RepID=UPI000C53A29E|nr:cupin domain-containing protein [Gimesia sp.]MAX39224.1 cupin [Gimesia sp.]HBL48446.1 cupin [Planctomycetaceae bacterium]|tara:strand:- start:11559 stop:11927 length:369 start_codon:yes stop_codon:yes gene_type:complete
MPRYIELPTIVKAAGNKPKQIEEFVGRVNTGDETISVARMVSPGGWVEPAQSPEFQEMSVVLKGVLHVETKQGIYEVKTGQAIILDAGEWVRYSTPGEAGAEYIAICLPAFSPETVHRETDD